MADRAAHQIDRHGSVADQPAIGDMESSVAGSLYRAARLIINLRWTGDAPPAVMIRPLFAVPANAVTSPSEQRVWWESWQRWLRMQARVTQRS